MLILLLILSVAVLVATIIIQSLVKKNKVGSNYALLAMIQSACIAAMVAILAV